jgi:hypothetical protein
VVIDIEGRTADSGRVRVTSKAGVIDVLIKVEAPPPGSRGGETLRNPCGVNCPTVPPGGPPN